MVSGLNRIPINVSVARDSIVLGIEDLEVYLSKEDALSLLSWLEQTIDRSVLFLYRCDLADGAIEGRNYEHSLDFLVFREQNNELRVRRFGIPKCVIPALVSRLAENVNSMA